MLNFRFNSFYKKSFYAFVGVYLGEIIFSLWIYPHLKSAVPMHLGISGVDEVTNAKYVIFLLPVACWFASWAFKSEMIDRKYVEGSITSNLLKVILFLLQLFIAFTSIYYFYILYVNYTI